MNTRTALIGAALVVVAIILFVVLKGGGDDEDNLSVSGGAAAKSDTGKQEGDAGKSEKKPSIPTVVVGQDGKPVGGVTELTYKKGDQIHFKVEVPFEEEVHLHGYDVMKEVPEGGGTVTYDLPAEIEGIFEAELEGKGEQIVELKVEP